MTEVEQPESIPSESTPTEPRTVKPHRGGTVLVVGILSLFTSCLGLVFGLSALMMGSSDLSEMAEGRMDRSGRGLTRVGRVLGIIGIVLGLLSILVMIVTYLRTR